jgi:glycosyltransferase involved in cell wall biosynthesis
MIFFRTLFFLSVILFTSVFEIAAKPKISVIIPVYNTEKFLRVCLDSVLNQTLTDFEIICVDDRSTDRCPKILREYAAKDERVRVVRHRKNAGMAAARNTGLDAAEGDFIAFSDSDDYMQPDMLKIMYEGITKNNADLIICNVYKIQEHDKPVFKKNIRYTVQIPPNSFMHTHMYYKNGDIFPVWNKMYRKSAIASVRFDPELFGTDDAYFNLCVAPFIKKYVTTNAMLYCWRQHPNSNSRSKAKISRKIEGYCRWIKKVHDSPAASRLSSEQKLIYCCQIATFCSAEIIVNYGYDELIYTSRCINDLYSDGLMDFVHCKGVLIKIVMASVIIIGKVQKLLDML